MIEVNCFGMNEVIYSIWLFVNFFEWGYVKIIYFYFMIKRFLILELYYIWLNVWCIWGNCVGILNIIDKFISVGGKNVINDVIWCWSIYIGNIKIIVLNKNWLYVCIC